MSSENSISKGKAVVKEEVSPLTAVEHKPLAAVMSNPDNKAKLKEEQKEEVSLPPIHHNTAAPHHHHQTPPNDVPGSDGNKYVFGVGSGVQDVGSSSSASATAAHMMQQATIQFGAVAAPTLVLPAFQLLDSSRILLVKEVMQHCVTALATGDVLAANTGLVVMSTLASAAGDPLQRVAFAFAEALGRRALQQLLPGMYGGLMQVEVPRQLPAASSGYTIATRLCFDALCPLLRVAASAANHVIATAMEGEERVHVIDLGGASPNQWLELLHLLAVRPGGPPSSLRLTVVSEEERLLPSIAWLLHREAARLRIPLEFNLVRSHIDRLSPADVASFGVDGSEALAISSTLQLHRLIADEVTSLELPTAADHHHHNGHGHGKRGRGKGQKPQKQPRLQITKADALLRVLCDLSPKLMVVTEQEADHNGGSLGDRVRSALDYYVALFNDLEAGGAARESADRAFVERVLLREEIMDIVARDGPSRRERHEGTMSWARRMAMAWFRPLHLQRVRSFDAFADPGLLALQLSFHANATLRYWVAQDNTSFTIYANTTPMFSVTAWRPETDADE